jgi:hypothetical protein
VLGDLDVCGVDVGVSVDKMGSDDGGELFWRIDGVLLGEDVACLLLGVRRNDNRVVCAGIAGDWLGWA